MTRQEALVVPRLLFLVLKKLEFAIDEGVTGVHVAPFLFHLLLLGGAFEPDLGVHVIFILVGGPAPMSIIVLIHSHSCLFEGEPATTLLVEAPPFMRDLLSNPRKTPDKFMKKNILSTRSHKSVTPMCQPKHSSRCHSSANHMRRHCPRNQRDHDRIRLHILTDN